jgi:hypothetical protein
VLLYVHLQLLNNFPTDTEICHLREAIKREKGRGKETERERSIAGKIPLPNIKGKAAHPSSSLPSSS